MQHESERDGGREIDTGGGAATSGNVDAGRDFVGRDSITNQYYGTQPQPAKHRRQRSRGDLTVAEATVLWEAIRDLSESVGGLKVSIEQGNRETSKLASVIDQDRRSNEETKRLQQQQFQVMDKAITTLQTSLAELGLTPKSQREPKWKTDLLVWSTAVIAVAAVIGLSYLLFGGG